MSQLTRLSWWLSWWLLSSCQINDKAVPSWNQAAIMCLPSVTVKVAVAVELPLPSSDNTISFTPALSDDTEIDSGNTAVRKKEKYHYSKLHHFIR